LNQGGNWQNNLLGKKMYIDNISAVYENVKFMCMRLKTRGKSDVPH